MSSPQDAPKYSVLVLGSTQAGKSALIEHVRSYADPDYVIDESHLGNGITSKTDIIIPFLIESNLPTYEAYRKDTGVAFELKNLATQYKDEEDYRNALLSHSDDVGMRLVPQNTTAPSGSMEFRFLDTPGFNGTQDRDSEYAATIVNEVISTRSFNLIVFVISSKNPLTEEKQLALEYFAYILRGLHSRIVFLYTHVDFADTHHSNITHHLDMSMRSKTISMIFRRHDGESVFDEFNIIEYPCLNIDLTTRNRPIVQCLIRNTIREILTMATAPPAILDTSTCNIERIRAVTYPNKLDQEQRKYLEATLRKNIAKPKYSVLIMGKTQAGKSALIEHIKNYANLSYAIDQSLLGNGNLSKLESTQPLYVKSNLPAYEVYRRDTGEVIDLDDLPSKFNDEEDYRDILFLRERDVGLRQAPQDPSNPPDNVEFRFLDSLGFKNTDENDSDYAAFIIDRLILIQTFNLIVITESYKNLLTQEQQLDLEYFAKVFKGLHSRIMFLHTHVDYTNIHPTNSTHHLNMKMKNKALSKLFRRHDNEVPFDENDFEEYPSLTIDLVSKKRPVINCLIRNTIRKILKIATRPAVVFDTSIHNIERIRAIPYPTQLTDEQLKQAKARLQVDADKFEEVQAEVQAKVQVVEQAKMIVVLPTSGWFYIKSQSSGFVVDVEQDADPLAPNVLVSMNAQITPVIEENQAKVESQLWKYEDGQLINRRSRLVLDCKQGVVRYGARLMQGLPKQGKEGHHQRWESSNGTLVIQGKPLYTIDIEGDGTKTGARLSLQRPKVRNNLDQQWTFQIATYEWLKVERVITRTVTETTTSSSKVVNIEKNDWFFIKSGATGLVMDLEAGWITQPTDVGAYISMKKQRSLEESDRALLERQLWCYEDGYLINRRTNYVVDIYGRSAVVGVKLIQQYKATTEADGKINQLWNVVDGNIQLLHNPKLVINVESNKDGSRVQLVEHKAVKTTVNTWTLELARDSWLKQTLTRSSTIEELEEAQISVHAAFPQDKWFYVKSKASGLVLDVEHGFWRDHTKAGANIELNHQKLFGSSVRHALLELQLWRFESGFIINRRTGLVLDVSGNCLKASSRIIQWTRKSEGNTNQQWAVSNGFIHLKSQPNFVLDVDGDGTRDGARISLGERKEKKNLDQRWSFEAVTFSWLTSQTSYTYTTETDEELLKEYESSHLARVKEHQAAPVDCWFYLKSGISDLVLEIEHSRQINHLKSGAHIQLAHQKLKSGKHSHALLELQLWRFQDSYIINRRSGLVLAVEGVHSSAKLIQSSKTGAETQRWVVKDGVLRLAAHLKFALFLSYGHQGARAFIREVRRNELVQRWSFAEVRFSWLTLERTVNEVEEEQLNVLNESETSYLKRELVRTREIERFTNTTYFYIRASNGNVVDIEHGLFKNHMKAGAYAALHPQTTAASANQHALLDIQLWSYVDGYLINKRTGLALTVQGDAQSRARLVQELPHNTVKWTLEGGYIHPQHKSELVISIENDQIVLIERSMAVTWTVYEVSFSWLVWTEITLITEEQVEDIEFYEEFEEVVVRSSARSGEVIEYAVTEQYVVAPKESWFYLVAGCRVAAINHDQITERGCDGASVSLVAQKRFSSAQRHALLELQLWKFEDSYIINRHTGLYLTVNSFGALITTTKQTDVTRQQWHFSEDGSLSLISGSSQVVDFVNDSAVLVERSASKTIWLYETVQASWLTSLESSTRTDYREIQTEITEYRTVYNRYVQYITKYTVITTTTTRTTRRVVRVHSQSSLQNASVYEQGNTTWACHLVEAGTGVEYVLQLLQDNTTNVYYIYIQWGSIEGQLEGPYESAEKATIEFQELFQTKIGVEWTEREVAISDSWTSVEFEYDTITIEDESAKAIGATQNVHTTKIVSASKSLVDVLVPIADQVTVYYDSDVYHTILTDKSTGVTYVNQLLYNHVTKTYYVYLRSGETEYILDGPYETIETAKAQFVTKYSTTFGISWEERKTVTNTKWTVVQQTFETTEEYSEYVSDDEEVETIATIGAKDTIGSTEHITIVHQSETTVSQPVYNETERVTSTTTTLISEPKTIKSNGWFRRLATGAGVAAVGALIQVDGVWKRTLNVLTTRKGHVDAIAPVSETSVVYYDETDVYDSVLIEKSTGVTYVTQLIYDTKVQKYYVYYRWSETDYKLDGPHDTIEVAKEAFQVTYKEKFGLEWTTRETTVSEQWTYEVKTYETYEYVEEIEEIVEEDEAQVIIQHEREIHVDETMVKTDVTTVTSQNELVLETVQEEAVVVDEQIQSKETIVTKTEEEHVKVDVSIEEVVKEVEVLEEVENVTKKHIIAQPAVTKNNSWFRKLAVSATAVASGADAAASGALTKVDGVWKRTVEVLTTRKACVDEVAPVSKTSIVYYDETDVYDSVLIEKSTGVTYVTQLIYDTKIQKYYVYVRWSETEYKLDGPHDTIEVAKEAFQVTYKEKFGLEWTTRETTVSEQWTYEVKTYETYEEIEYVQEVYEEEEAQIILKQEKEIIVSEDVTVSEDTTTTTTVEEVSVEHITETTEIVVEEEAHKEKVTEVVIETGKTKPAVTKESSWLKKAVGGVAAIGDGAVAVTAGAVKSGAHHVSSGVHHVASGVGSATAGALEKVDGVWKRTVQVLTTRKAHVDKVAPIAETSYVYYDEEVYDSVLVEKSTGITYITQLLFDTKVQKYYVYVRWGETDYKLDGPHDTIESAKSAFQVTYKERFGLEWETRETTVSEQWTYEVKTYETFEEMEYVEEIVEETEAVTIIEKQQEIIVNEMEVEVSEETVTEVTEETKETTIVTSTEEVVEEVSIAEEETVSTQVIVEESTESKVVVAEEESVSEISAITKEAEVAIQVEVKEQEVEVVEETVTETTTTTTTTEEVVLEHQTETTQILIEEEDRKEKATEIVIETGKTTEVAAPKGTSWFKKAVGGAVAVGVGAVAVTAGAVASGAGAIKTGAHHVSSGVHQVAFGAGSAAAGALEKVDGVWKRIVQVLTTLKAHVDSVAPIAETSYVYYDEEVYDSVLVEKSTGITYITQLLFDTKVQKYYVYVRWGETDYKLDGPHDTIEVAKEAFQVTYKEKFGLEWTTRETTVSEQWTYEVKTYETYEEIEYVEEIIEEEQAQFIIKQGKEIAVSEDVTVSKETTAAAILTGSGGVVPEGCKNLKHGKKTADSDSGSGSGSGSDGFSTSSSVLVLGKTQAGKSTFIEFVKNYANQQYTINESLLGTGFRSKTQMPVQFVVRTDLQAYEVFDATGTRIDIDSLGDQHQDLEDYFDALNDRKATLKSVPRNPASSLPRDVEITFLDTPGFEDTNGRDAENAERIIDSMTQMQSFNLIIIIINCEETPSKAYQLAFNYYSKVICTFQGHHSNIVFLYTHVEYEKCHHSNANHLSIMELRHKAFSQLFQCQGSYNHEAVSKAAVEPYPKYHIDFDKRQRPITKCMRLMTLRGILTRVVNSPAVTLDISVSNLLRIQAINHPDELNQAQRKKPLEMTCTIIEQGQEPQDFITVSVVSRECTSTLKVNSSGECSEDRDTDLFVCERDDEYKEYFF